MSKQPKHPWILVLAAGLVLILGITMTISIYVGSVDLVASDVGKIIINRLSQAEIFPVTWQASAETIVWDLRLPKTLVAALTGMGLSLAGALMQTLTHNPMADPYLLGISSGASTGAVLSILVGTLPVIGYLPLEVGAFLGALLATDLVFLISGKQGKLSTIHLILTGVALSALFSALTSIIIFLTPDVRAISSALFWMSGSFSGISWKDVAPVAIAVLLSSLILFLIHQPLDLLLLGDDRARMNGINVFALKSLIFVITSLLTAILVAKSGVIGFVGLVIPHITRLLVGPTHRRLLLVAPLAGAILMVVADTVSRVVFSPEELPVGIVTALVGAPFFIFLMQRSKDKLA